LRNYKQRIPLGPEKWAYEQDEAFEAAAKEEVREIKKIWKRPGHFYHLRRGGHIAAARLHLSSNYFAKVDLRRFFEQVTRNRVVKRLTTLGMSFERAEDFAIASTVRHAADQRRFALPYGFVQSPLLASIDLDLSALGRQILKLKSAGIRVSAYVDDIIISSEEEQAVKDGFEALVSAAAVANYEINQEKSQNCGAQLRVFNLDISRGSMAVADERFAEFQEGIALFDDSAESIAIALYVESVNPAQADELIRMFPRQLATAAVVLDRRRAAAARKAEHGHIPE
jgi:hypothetical protein